MEATDKERVVNRYLQVRKGVKEDVLTSVLHSWHQEEEAERGEKVEGAKQEGAKQEGPTKE